MQNTAANAKQASSLLARTVLSNITAASAHLPDNPKDPLAVLRVLRTQIARNIKEARQPILDAREYNDMLREVARCLRKGEPPPLEAPLPIASAVYALNQVVEGLKHLQADPNAVADEIERCCDVADEKLKQALKAFRKYESTAAIASAQAAANYLMKFPELEDEMARWLLRAEERKSAHRRRFGTVKQTEALKDLADA